MDSIIDALYEYAQEQRIRDYLETWDYRRATSEIEEGWERFRSTLTAEQGEWLDALLTQEFKINRLEDRAAFCSALSIGMTLGRL